MLKGSWLVAMFEEIVLREIKSRLSNRTGPGLKSWKARRINGTDTACIGGKGPELPVLQIICTVLSYLRDPDHETLLSA